MDACQITEICFLPCIKDMHDKQRLKMEMGGQIVRFQHDKRKGCAFRYSSATKLLQLASLGLAFAQDAALAANLFNAAEGMKEQTENSLGSHKKFAVGMKSSPFSQSRNP